jgi:hypothetical protein
MDHRGNQACPCRCPRAILLALSVLLLGFVGAHGQPRGSTLPPPPAEPGATNSSKPDSPQPDFGSPESEMRARLILKAEKKQYDENVARAREASELATQLVGDYEARRVFNSDDGKKFERLEKLTKRIRNEAGGSETEPDAKDIPGALEAAVKQVAELADDLRKLVEKTPRHVVSASVINQANKLLGLIQHVRGR